MKNSVKTVTLGLLIGGSTLLWSPYIRSQPAGGPDIVYHSGHIVTIDDDFTIVEALAVRDGKIVALGSNADIKALALGATRLVDLGEKTMLPGLYDSHVHLSFGGGGNTLDLRHVKTIEELQETLKREVTPIPEGQWIFGRISETSFPELKLPTRWDLDEATPRHPMALRLGFRLWVVNSLALEKAGITRMTPDPQGGKIARDERGVPNGVLREPAAQRMVGRLLPPSPRLEDETARRNVRAFLRELVSLGITSINVAGLRPGNQLRWVQDSYQRWGEELPRMTVQLQVRPGSDGHDDIEEGVRDAIRDIEGMSFHTGFGNDRLKLGAIKMGVDGGSTSLTAWVLEPYPDGSRGLNTIPQSAFYPVAKRAHDLGWQLGIHAVGDAAVQMTVNVFERILRESPREDHRHYLHHVAIMPPEDTLRKMTELGILVSSQPSFTYDLAPNYEAALAGKRLETNNPQRSLLERGIRMAYGSDHRPYGPIVGIWAAVNRIGRNGKVYGPSEAVSVKEAIRLHTMGPAYLTFDENNRGSLEVGKWADMVVLTEDILSVDPVRIREIGIEKTIIQGEIIYSADIPKIARFDDGVVWTVENLP